MLSPAALWSCLIVFLLDPPPENFEQLTSGKHLLDRWLKFTFFLHFKKNQQAYLGRKLCVTVNQQHFMVWNDEEITLKEMSKFQVISYIVCPKQNSEVIQIIFYKVNIWPYHICWKPNTRNVLILLKYQNYNKK